MNTARGRNSRRMGICLLASCCRQIVGLMLLFLALSVVVRGADSDGIGGTTIGNSPPASSSNVTETTETNSLPVSMDGRCGVGYGNTTCSSEAEPYCSTTGYCGSTEDHVETCQPTYSFEDYCVAGKDDVVDDEDTGDDSDADDEDGKDGAVDDEDTGDDSDADADDEDGQDSDDVGDSGDDTDADGEDGQDSDIVEDADDGEDNDSGDDDDSDQEDGQDSTDTGDSDDADGEENSDIEDGSEVDSADLGDSDDADNDSGDNDDEDGSEVDSVELDDSDEADELDINSDEDDSEDEDGSDHLGDSDDADSEDNIDDEGGISQDADDGKDEGEGLDDADSEDNIDADDGDDDSEDLGDSDDADESEDEMDSVDTDEGLDGDDLDDSEDSAGDSQDASGDEIDSDDASDSEDDADDTVDPFEGSTAHYDDDNISEFSIAASEKLNMTVVPSSTEIFFIRYYFDSIINDGGAVDLTNMLVESNDFDLDDDVTFEDSKVEFVLFRIPDDVCEDRNDACMGEWPKWGVGGIGRKHQSAAPVLRWCCTPEAVSEGACEGPGDNHVIVNRDGFDNIQHSSVRIPGEKSHVMSHVRGQYVEQMNGLYAVLIVNCNDRGRPAHVSGTLDWMEKVGGDSTIGADGNSTHSADGSDGDTNSTSLDDTQDNTTVIANATIHVDDTSNSTTTNKTITVEDDQAISTNTTDADGKLNFTSTNGYETTQSKSIFNGNKGIANKAIPTGDNDSLNTTETTTPTSSIASSTVADTTNTTNTTIGTADEIYAPSKTFQPVVDVGTEAPTNNTTGYSDVVSTVLPTPGETTEPPVNPATGEIDGVTETSRPTSAPTVSFDQFDEDDDDDDDGVQEDDQFERDDDGGPLPMDDDYDDSSSNSNGGSGGGGTTYETPGINTEEEDVEQVESAFLSQFGLQDMPLWKSAGGVAAVAVALLFVLYYCRRCLCNRRSRRKTVRADSWDWNDSDDDAEFGIPAKYNEDHEYGEIPNSLMA